MDDFYSEVISQLLKRQHTKQELNKLKNRLSKKFGLNEIPTDADILLRATPAQYRKLSLITKPTRTLSGVAPIAMMSKPHRCPHGTCIYCPGGPGSVFGDVPQSYTGREPSTMRSMRNHYDPYLIVFNRLEQYIVLNQNPEKVEIIIQGGTFPSLTIEYQDEYVAYAFKAMNDFSEMFYKNGFDIILFRKFFELPGDIHDKERTKRVQQKLLKFKGQADLKKEQLRNETSRIRCVGLTIETKPDWGLLEHAGQMLRLGCTRVELGVQTTDEKKLKYVNRGHTLADTIESTRILKDLGFKINYHMMPGLPMSTPESDIKELIGTLDNPDYRPDMFKIYPTMVLKGTALHRLMHLGKYKPIDMETASRIIVEFKKHVPHWVRIMRVQRDIPTEMTEAGVEKTNLRQYIDKRFKSLGLRCKCIRCREAGLASRSKNIEYGQPQLYVEEYEASKGKEFFISFEDPGRELLFGYCRLRIPSQSLRPQITKTSALLRELHIVGSATGLGEEGSVQHKGLGKKLLKKAEEITRQNGRDKMVVISGVGAREYYRKLGYVREGAYMSKTL